MNAPHSSVLLHQACDGHLASQQLIDMAFEIADNAARSDIECFAFGRHIPGDGSYWIYSLTETTPVCDGGEDGPKVTHDEAIDDLRIVQRAARYIRERGNIFPWRMVEVDGHPGFVRFVDKEGRPVDPGVPA